MYNRYVPQPDGSHQRNRVAEQIRPSPAPPPPPVGNAHQAEACAPKQHIKRQSDTITGLLRNLLPKNLDSGDLIILLLLLLMANDCEENRNNALLTMALYFFL